MGDKRYFRCPECRVVSSSEDWDTSTSAPETRKLPISGNRKNDCVFTCPHCQQEQDGSAIEEVFSESPLKKKKEQLKALTEVIQVIKEDKDCKKIIVDSIPTCTSFTESEHGIKPDNFDIFIDRVESLVKRWKTFYDKNKDFTDISKHCIKGFLSEVNDGFTKQLMEKDFSKVEEFLEY